MIYNVNLFTNVNCEGVWYVLWVHGGMLFCYEIILLLVYFFTFLACQHTGDLLFSVDGENY